MAALFVILVMPDISSEIKFKTSRSGGKGGQNVNKVETRVEGFWNVTNSILVTEEEKARIVQKLGNKISSEGNLQVASQAERSQRANKELVIAKLNLLLQNALRIPKKRKATKPSKASVKNRLEKKKQISQVKLQRRKPGAND